MNIHKLDRIFNPYRIALIGVTTNPKSVGGKVLSNLVGSAFRGVVYPVNPSSEAVMGIPCYPDLKSLPRVPDLGVICAPAEQVPEIVRECGEAGIMGLIIMSAGFRETGPKGIELENQIIAELKKFPGMRILGPNCLGVIVPHLSLNISFAEGMPKAGHIAFISQSGALCASVLDWALEEKIGFSYFVSIGNALDVDFSDLIDYFGEDQMTKSSILYIESIRQARKFMTAARAFARSMPIVAYKAGRFPESAQVAASHTGAMAAEDDIYDAAFQRIGIARVFELGDIFDCAELIGKQKIPAGPRLAIVTNAGGPGVMATDALIAANGTLAKLSDQSIDQLNENLPPCWSHGNPVDVLGDARSKRIIKALRIVLDDPGVDAVLVILTPQAMTNPTTTAKAIAELAATTKKPILATWMGGAQMTMSIGLLNEAGVPTYMTPEQGVRAFMTLVAYSRNLQALYETPKEIPVQFPLGHQQLREQFKPFISGEHDPEIKTLSEEVSKRLLAAYGIPTVSPIPAGTAEEAVSLANQIGYPVVLKIMSPDITHKSDVGGVILDIQDELGVREAFTRITCGAKQKRPDARIEGVTVQKMIRSKDGVELIMGAKKDPVFGTVIMVGMGGITAELFKDRVLGFPPLNERLARRMLESLKVWPLLQGYRGRPGVNIERLIEALIRLSYLVADFPEISELDINPLLVTAEDTIALDARIILDPTPQVQTDPYAHLALHPYPDMYVKPAQMEDGTMLLFRPIKPEDEPMWKDMLSRCSKESIYARFRSFFRWDSHEAAIRYCFTDYDREIAIVAEQHTGDTRRLVGVGRLIADPNHETVEYAVLVTDEFQNKGLGSIMTDYCMEIAQKWNLKQIVAETTTENRRMMAVFQRRNFDVKIDPSSSLVEVSLLF
ncbi:MAG: bifunctional acetate--CoA ligase family protein/GNAT family N-acetyltransferase [Candidatus Omnitrophota bacterium]